MTALTKNNRSDFFTAEPFSLAKQFFGFDPFLTTARAPAKSSRPPAFVPRFDVVEREEGYLVRADLPGVAEEDLDVTLHDGVLTVAGKRAAEERQEGDNFHLYERRYGEFTRRFSLPDNVDEDAVAAELKNGVLAISIGKKAESKPRKIKVG